MKRSLYQRCTNPQNNLDRYVMTCYRASVENAGKDFDAELQRLAGMAQSVADGIAALGTPTPTTPEAKARGLFVPPIRRPKRTQSKTGQYRAEWDKMNERDQRRQHNFDSFVMRREHGLVDHQGHATG